MSLSLLLRSSASFRTHFWAVRVRAVRVADGTFTFHPSYEGTLVWSPDGRGIVFPSDREVAFGLSQKDASRAGDEDELLLKTPPAGFGSFTESGIKTRDGSMAARRL